MVQMPSEFISGEWLGARRSWVVGSPPERRDDLAIAQNCLMVSRPVPITFPVSPTRERNTAGVGTTMQRLTEPLDAAIGQKIEASLARLRNSSDFNLDLLPVLDVAIGMTGADMGTLQRYDGSTDQLILVASRGFSSETLSFFSVVRRDTSSTCAAALAQRMRVFVQDISTSYLFVGTRELDVLSANGVAAVQSTPLISSAGGFCGVLSTHFRKMQPENAFDHAPLDRFAVQIADSLEHQEGLTPSRQATRIPDRGD
jgi:hypothetical protein